MNPIIDFKSKTQALDTLKSECIYLTQIEPLNSIEVHPKLDTPLQYFEAYNMLFSKINPKLDLCLNLLKLALVWAIAVFLVALRNFRSYSSLALSKISKSVLAGCKFSTGVHSAQSGFFVRNISMRSHLNGEAGEGHFRVCRSPVEPVCYPFQLCHQLAVNGKAPTIQQERINHA